MADGRNGRKYRIRSRTALSAVLLLLALCAAASAIFFRVQRVEIDGESLYSETQIREASGIRDGASLLLTRSANISAKIFETLPYVEAIQIQKRLPGTVVVTVTESSPVACIFAEGSWWVLDAAGRVMQETDNTQSHKLIELKGITPEPPEVGKSLTMEDRDIGEELSEILGAILRANLADKVSVLNCAESADMTFLYDDRLTVHLGTSYQTEKKLHLMSEVLKELEKDAKGILDLSVEEKARFIPTNVK